MARDHACRVDVRGNGALPRVCPRVRSIELGNGTARSAQKTVIHIARVKVESHDRSSQVNGVSEGALVGFCAGARSVECDDGEPEGRVAEIQDVSPRTRSRQLD